MPNEALLAARWQRQERRTDGQRVDRIRLVKLTSSLLSSAEETLLRQKMKAATHHMSRYLHIVSRCAPPCFKE